MKIAVCIKGMFDHSIESFSNINENVFRALKEEGHELKTFIVSQLDEEVHSFLAISEKIKPEKIWLSQNRKIHRTVNPTESSPRSSLQAFLRVVPLQLLDCCKIVRSYEAESGYEFDAILIIRMDILLNRKITKEAIDFTKVNMECMFVPDMNSGDNIFWIPRMYFDKTEMAFSNVVSAGGHSHEVWKYLEKLGIPLHYIGGETGKRLPYYDVVFRFSRYFV
jgi:hypothetical protein